PILNGALRTKIFLQNRANEIFCSLYGFLVAGNSNQAHQCFVWATCVDGRRAKNSRFKEQPGFIAQTQTNPARFSYRASNHASAITLLEICLRRLRGLVLRRRRFYTLEKPMVTGSL